MSRKKANQKRTEILRQLWDLGRKLSTLTVFLHQAIAQSFGLNATDTKCIDVILSQPAGSVTAGQISDVTGLTTGAITHILDRLEKRGLIERVRDARDRRKVFVYVKKQRLAPLFPKYEAIGKAHQALAEQYGTGELQLICEYLQRSYEVSEHELAKMIAANRSER
jgi:DNA-binding MarR family transcriptional regulator